MKFKITGSNMMIFLEKHAVRVESDQEAITWLSNVIATKWRWYVRESSRGDIEIRKPEWRNYYSIVVKKNMLDSDQFFIDTDSNGWLFNGNSHRIWHCNVKTGHMAWYDREAMKQFIRKQNLVDKGLICVEPSFQASFLSRRPIK